MILKVFEVFHKFHCQFLCNKSQCLSRESAHIVWYFNIKSKRTDQRLFSCGNFKTLFLSKPDLTRPGSGSWFACCSRPWGPSHCSKPDRGRAAWACHIYYKHIVISHISTVCLHNFFPVRHIDSDQYINHIFITTPRNILSP